MAVVALRQAWEIRAIGVNRIADEIHPPDTQNTLVAFWGMDEPRFEHPAEAAQAFGRVFQQGRIRLEYQAPIGDAWRSPILLDPTYRDVWGWATQALRESGDCCHTYLDRLVFKDTREGVRIYDLKMRP